MHGSVEAASPMAEHFATVDVRVGDELFWFILQREPRARDGLVELTGVPGLGLTVNQQALRNFQMTE